MKKTRKNQMFKGLLLTLMFTFGVFVWCSDSVVTLAAGTAKVVASSGKIRAKADTGSDTIASVKKGDTLDVIASSSDSDGYTWYKVYVDDEETGYIRADLVTIDGNVSPEKTTESDDNKNTSTTTKEDGGNKTVVGSNNSTETEKKEETKTEVKTEIKTEVAVVNVSQTDVTAAKATADVRVRKGAGTKFDVVGQAKNGTEVTISGVAADSDGKNWYQVSFNEGNKTINGFIREDFLEITSRVEAPVVEEPAVEEPVVEAPVVENQDYYLKYMPNDAGEMDWYLFNNIEGTSQSLTQLLNVVDQVKEQGLEESEQISTMRFIIIALAVVLVALIVAVTVLIFKLRDAYEYEYDEEEDDEDIEDEEDDNEDDEEEDDEEEDDEEEDEKVRKPRFGFLKRKGVIDEEEDDDEEEEEEEETLKEIPPVKPSKPAKVENKAWQSKDFLELDDDMEFEFLDL